MATLSELTVQVLAARLTKKEMSLEELQHEMTVISNMIKAIDEGASPETPAEPKPEKVNFKKVFGKDKVVCLICNKEFTTLKRHLSMAHGLKPGEYKKQFNIPAKYALVATTYSEKRKKDAIDRGLGDNLAKARAAKVAKKPAAPKQPKTSK